MIAKVLQPKNLYKAYRQVEGNKGASGGDGMKVSELKSYIDENRKAILTSILNRKYRRCTKARGESPSYDFLSCIHSPFCSNATYFYPGKYLIMSIGWCEECMDF